MSSKKYHVHATSLRHKKPLAVHMYDTLAEAISSSKRMIRKGWCSETAILRRELDGRSYEPFRKVSAWIHNGKIMTINVYALPENELLR